MLHFAAVQQTLPDFQVSSMCTCTICIETIQGVGVAAALPDPWVIARCSCTFSFVIILDLGLAGVAFDRCPANPIRPSGEWYVSLHLQLHDYARRRYCWFLHLTAVHQTLR